ncbi:PEGA domain-containing protein [Bradyrhizobium sp. WYCCWR 13023]|uniref:PEGA domain-containing protein n=1 Tax=Bradyrhizobium zhengyangense TaxID=2911009 RepID=A0A9X1RCT9_9BRAD|nr:PEGA domain-containing protein [Bradyrhizobium zhengyangense]MCG2630126.1 PEGA domain-containing protein [Bradyrhizobium zhengyangense]MCG2671973.1 PEGA domain-containing protein [Bradyrhizobium zhengyangense]
MRLFGIMALSVMLGGCASVTRGTTENISISSTPSGVEAVVSGLEVPTTCMTPCSVVVKRNADVSITFQKEGYEPQIVPLSRDIQTGGAAGFAGNLLLGGAIGMGVDAATGAATDHKPNPVIVTMQPVAAPPRARPPAPKKPRPPAAAAPEAGT